LAHHLSREFHNPAGKLGKSKKSEVGPQGCVFEGGQRARNVLIRYRPRYYLVKGPGRWPTGIPSGLTSFSRFRLLCMAIRDEIHSLIDQLPEDQLQNVRPFLAGLLRPRAQSPEIEQARQLTHQYKKMVEQRFRETRKPGTISALVGGGSVFPKEGRVSGDHSFHYWDDKALVHQTLRIFEGQELEIMERVSRSQDGATLVYEQELSSGGLTKRHDERISFSGFTGTEDTISNRPY